MPGRTPAEAVDAFLDPLRDALRILDGVAKLLISPKGGFRKGVRYSWVLNGADGMDLGAVGRFIASMEFEIIDADPTKNEAGSRSQIEGNRVLARSWQSSGLRIPSLRRSTGLPPHDRNSDRKEQHRATLEHHPANAVRTRRAARTGTCTHLLIAGSRIDSRHRISIPATDTPQTWFGRHS
jgi:hypothetical protein